MKIKICGITNIEDALLCEKSGADALGFIFYKKSKRYISPEIAASIIKGLSPFTIKVGVFVNESKDKIDNIVTKSGINMIQLHGDEDEIFANSFSRPVIKSFRINSNYDFSNLERYKNTYFLLDSFSKDIFGGTGNTFKWESIPMKIRNKIILAGGINEDNIEKAYEKIIPAAVDISSSLETEPGKKDHQKVKSLFKKFNNLRHQC